MVNKIVVFIIFLFWIGLTRLPAQNSSSQLYSYFEQHRYSELQDMVEKEKETTQSSFDIQFFKALFIQDGEKAGKIYDEIYKKASGKAKFYAAKKLMDFYYAKGYYVHASEYEKYMVEHQIRQEEPVISAPAMDSTVYFIQVGAFSLRENAMQRVGFLAVQNIKSKVVEKLVNGKILYCVWIPGKENIDKTLQIANQIKQKYALEYHIKKR